MTASESIIRRRRLAFLIALGLALSIGIAFGAAIERDKPAAAERSVAATDERAAGAGAETAIPSSRAASDAPDRPDSGLTPAVRARKPVDRLTLRQQVGQLVMLRFSGTTAPDYVLEAFRRRRANGAILFGDNITSSVQLRSLTRTLRAAGQPLIATDQEGGSIRNVGWAQPDASQSAQRRTGTVRSSARAAARELRKHGITVSLAPVVDVPSVTGAAMAGRAFAFTPAAVSKSTEESVAGWRAGGVAPTVKHFPGIGGATVNTDLGAARIDRSRTEILREDVKPFRAAIAAGVPLVMVGHAFYPALDRGWIASQSAAIIGGLLRERLGFNGVVITDSMEARASLATGGVEETSERAIRAGADIVLLTGRGSFTPVSRRLLATARRSPQFRARVRESAARVLWLKSSLGEPGGRR